MVRRATYAAALVLLAGCGSTDPTPSSYSVGMRIERGPSLSLADWERTGWIKLRAVTTQKHVLIDTTVEFSKRSMPSVSAKVDQGVSFEATGLDSAGKLTWYATTFLPGIAPNAKPERSTVLSAEPVSRPMLSDIAAKPFTLVESLGKGDSLLIRIYTSTPSCAIHYTLDGSNPIKFSPRYIGPVRAPSPCRLRAIALGDSVYPSLVLDTLLRSSQDAK